MKFHSSVIFVENNEKSKDFYVRLLKQEIEHDFGKNVILKNGLTLWKINPELTINRNLAIKGTSNRFELYFETELINDVFERMNSEGDQFLYKIQEEPWGQRTIRFFDYDKHLVEVGEPLETFVKKHV